MAQQKITGNEISTSQASITSNTQIASGVITSDKIVSVANTQIIGTTLPGPGQVNMIMLDSGNSTGNGAITIPRGNTAQRPANAQIGMTRYNTDTGVLENYTPQGWLKVSVPIPVIASISGTIYAGNTSTITINGSNFDSTIGTITFQISGNSPVTVSATPNAGGTQVSCLVPAGIYSAAAGSVVAITYTNTDGGVSGAYSMTSVGLPSGGTLVQTGNTRVHTFTSSSSLVVPTGFTATASYLIVAGGGSGNCGYINDTQISGGGGGAGGLLTGTTTLTAQTYGVTVGAGATWTYVQNTSASGSNSVFNSLTSYGGGGGGMQSRSGGPGGSGGGCGGNGATNYGDGTAGQGNRGGAGSNGSPDYRTGGGGGGSSSIGGTPTAGSGTSSSISGSAVTYAAGGAGGTGTGNGVAGTAYRGNGGSGGGYGSTVLGSNGGSGIVIVSYQLPI